MISFFFFSVLVRFTVQQQIVDNITPRKKNADKIAKTKNVLDTYWYECKLLFPFSRRFTTYEGDLVQPP